jgi:hypothetical protein
MRFCSSVKAQDNLKWIILLILGIVITLCEGTGFATSYPCGTSTAGHIVNDTTWTVANSPYIVNCALVVNNGVTLTIEPGVVVKFKKRVHLPFSCKGQRHF